MDVVLIAHLSQSCPNSSAEVAEAFPVLSPLLRRATGGKIKTGFGNATEEGVGSQKGHRKRISASDPGKQHRGLGVVGVGLDLVAGN